MKTMLGPSCAAGGEGWDTYRLGDVRGLAGWEVGAIRGGRLDRATDEHADRIAAMPDHAVVYARPIPEPPIKVGDRVTLHESFDRHDDAQGKVLEIRGENAAIWWDTYPGFAAHGGHVAKERVGVLRLLPAEPPSLTTHRCPS